MEKSLELSPEKRYHFPEDLAKIFYAGRVIIVSPSTANWIVLKEGREDFFNLLTRFTIEEALERYNGSLDDAMDVLVQVEARALESLITNPASEFSCQFNITNGCNLRCPHCFMNAGRPMENELTTDEIKSFIEKLPSCGISQISFSGGEITTRKDLIEIVEFAHSLNLKIDLLTNGVCWSDAMIARVAPIVNAVQISVDGYDEEENSKVRGADSFVKSLATLDKFIRSGVTARLAITPMPTSDLQNKKASYVAFAKKIRERYSEYPLRIVFTTGFMDGREIKLSDDQRKKYQEIMNGITSEYLGEDARDYPFILSSRKRLIMDNCGYGGLYVSANGDVKMCNKDFVVPVANIRVNTFKEIIQFSEEARRLSNINSIEPCRKCPVRYICGGGCRVDEFPELKNGNFADNITPRRDCSQEHKAEIYDLMIRTNESIFQ